MYLLTYLLCDCQSFIKESYLLTYLLQVKNIGNARVPGATLFIRWPYETSAGQHALYLLQQPSIVSTGTAL